MRGGILAKASENTFTSTESGIPHWFSVKTFLKTMIFMISSQELMIVCLLADARSCVTCDKVLAELEKIDDDTDSFGVDFVKINDKRLAKHYGIKTFPALTYFREKEPIIYEGQ